MQKMGSLLFQVPVYSGDDSMQPTREEKSLLFFAGRGKNIRFKE